MATYYVSANNGNNANSGSSVSSALQTLQAAAALTRPGDTVLVETGTYTSPQNGYALDITTSGTATQPIIYEAAPGATPTINVPAGAWGGISDLASWITLKGFQVGGDAQTLTLAYAQSQDGNLNNPITSANGIEVGRIGSPTASHVQILDNTVSYMPGAGISADYADYVTIQQNTVHNNASYSPYAESGITLAFSQNSDGNTGTKNYILDNTSYDNVELVNNTTNGPGLGITDGEGIIIDDNSNDQTNNQQYNGTTLVENNLVFGNGGPGVLAFDSSHVDVLNNTTYQDGQSDSNAYEIDIDLAHDAVVENNIMVAKPGGQTAATQDSTGVTWGFNLLYGGTSSVDGTHDISGNPLFINPGAENFETTAGSPAIGAANPAFQDATDLAGHGRPAAAEIGAFQYSSASPNDTVVKAGSASLIVDALSNTWGITGSGEVAVNGIADPTTANVIELAYVNGETWQENASDLWWEKTKPGDLWSPDMGTRTSPLPAPKPAAASPNGTMVTSVTSPPIVDHAGDVWSLVQSSLSGLQIAVDDTVDPITANVTMLEILNGRIEQENASGQWFSESGPNGPWVQIAAPSITVINDATASSVTVNGADATTTEVAGAAFVLTAPGVAQVRLGYKATMLQFTGMSAIALTGGQGASVITADGGNNTFKAGHGALTITGGTGSDTYIYSQFDGMMSLRDFSLAKGDILTIEKSLQASMTDTSDGHGGVIIGFGTRSPGVDLKGITSIAPSQIHFV